MGKHLFILLTFFICTETNAQDINCTAGAIRTSEAYLHGRFEVAMKSAEGDGVVSSFFLYNADLNCNWPEENNEIDIEMTGNNETVQFTTHYPPSNPGGNTWSVTHDETYGFNPHDSIHEYAFEWEPGIVRWFIDGQLMHVQDQPFVSGLIHPMRIHMNLWAANAPSWVGNWDPSIMPLESEYEYVRFYEYTPGNGASGTDNNFTFVWEDEFDELDEERWEVSQFGGFGGNFCSFETPAVEVIDGKLKLHMTDPISAGQTTAVTFYVDVSPLTLDATDGIFLNGGFNGWCGTCEPMSPDGDIWSVTIDLPPGKHQYLFTLNAWEESGGAPLGSECDFEPCDEWQNYGIIIDYDVPEAHTDTVCWSQCVPCETTSLEEFDPTIDADLLKITDLSGREVKETPGIPLLYYYSNGLIRKRVIQE